MRQRSLPPKKIPTKNESTSRHHHVTRGHPNSDFNSDDHFKSLLPRNDTVAPIRKHDKHTLKKKDEDATHHNELVPTFTFNVEWNSLKWNNRRDTLFFFWIGELRLLLCWIASIIWVKIADGYGVAMISRLLQHIGLFCRIYVSFVGLFCKRDLCF